MKLDLKIVSYGATATVLALFFLDLLNLAEVNK